MAALLDWLRAIGLLTMALLLAAHLLVLCANRRELRRLAEGPMGRLLLAYGVAIGFAARQLW